MSSTATRARSLYRRFLRELPARQPSMLANPSHAQQRIRSSFDIANGDERSFLAAEQYLTYLSSQRKYTTLLERYNPGVNMTEEDRVRLTARRVGMDLPEELQYAIGKGGQKGGKR